MNFDKIELPKIKKKYSKLNAEDVVKDSEENLVDLVEGLLKHFKEVFGNDPAG